MRTNQTASAKSGIATKLRGGVLFRLRVRCSKGRWMKLFQFTNRSCMYQSCRGVLQNCPARAGAALTRLPMWGLRSVSPTETENPSKRGFSTGRGRPGKALSPRSLKAVDGRGRRSRQACRPVPRIGAVESFVSLVDVTVDVLCPQLSACHLRCLRQRSCDLMSPVEYVCIA